jgi:hypothetical protein
MAWGSQKKGPILRSALEGISVSQMKFKEIRGDNLQNDRPVPVLTKPVCRENHFFLAALGAADCVTAARLVSAKSVACLTAF